MKRGDGQSVWETSQCGRAGAFRADPIVLAAVAGFVPLLTPALSVEAQPTPTDLFSAVDPSMATETGSPPVAMAPDPLVLRARFVTVDVGILAAARRTTLGATPGATLQLNLFDDVEFPATIDRTAPTRLGYALSGRLAGVELSRVTLVVNGRLLVGTVQTPRATYRIRPAAAGTHVIYQIDPSRLPSEGDPRPPAEFSGPDADGAAAPRRTFNVVRAPDVGGDSVGADDGSTVDVMVFYTPAARTGQGGRVAIEMLIDQFVDETNQAYQNSGVVQRLNLVHVDEVEHTEGTEFQDAELERRAEVLALREVYAADLVHFVIATDNYCGIANFMANVSHDFESRAFGYTDYRCGGATFAHELGHNMGLNHDRYSESQFDELSNRPYPYAYGYVNQRAFERGAPETSRWLTLMSYHTQCSDANISCTQLLRFSNPDMIHEGDPMGIAGDGASSALKGPSDARRTLNDTRMTVANFRRSSDRTRCTYVTTPTRQFVDSRGGTFSIVVATRPACSWTAASNAGFLSLSRSSSGAGSGMVEYRVAANSGSPRIGTIVVADQTFQVEQVGPVNQGICDRTALVRDAIMQAVADASTVGDTYCWDVTAADLSGVGWLDILGQDTQRLSELRAGDFSGLDGLESLSVVNHNLTSLPSDLFSGLSNLKHLWLVNNSALMTLPLRLFEDLSNLEDLYLYGNSLNGLPADVFVGLSGVESIHLDDNELAALRTGAFRGLASLKDLTLADNKLETLPVGIFADLPGLEVLRLHRNEFATLPAGIFAGLYGLRGFWLKGNPGAPFALTLELAPSGDGVVVGLREGAPFDMTVGLSVTGGTLSGSDATLSRGRTLSEPIPLTRHGSGPVTVSSGPAPAIPTGDCRWITPCYSGARIAVGAPLTFPGANRPPELVGTLAPLTIDMDEPAVTVDVSGAFRDLDGDRLTYGAGSSAPGVVSVSVTGSRVTVTPLSAGMVTVTVTATDVGGSNTPATQSFAVTVRRPFTDHPIMAGVTPVRAVHFTELRERINALLAAWGLGRFAWTDPVLAAGVTQVKLVHLVELRRALESAYRAAGRAAPPWTDAAAVAGTTPIRAGHLMELRAAVVALE